MFWPWRKKTEVWLDGFKEGFSQGVNIRGKEINDMIKKVEEKSTIDAIERMGKK